jgi:hypothetical protein
MQSKLYKTFESYRLILLIEVLEIQKGALSPFPSTGGHHNPGRIILPTVLKISEEV